jgi:hypothetical protein
MNVARAERWHPEPLTYTPDDDRCFVAEQLSETTAKLAFNCSSASSAKARTVRCRDPGPGPVSYTKETLKKRLRHNALLEFGNVILCLSPGVAPGLLFPSPYH